MLGIRIRKNFIFLSAAGVYYKICDLVYVVGISNWALDAAKMNRAVVLSRPDPDIEDLCRTGKAIVESFGRDLEKDGTASRLLRAVSETYHEYRAPRPGQTEAEVNFHGLRDYYSLARTIGRAPWHTPAIVAEAVARNFGGMPQSAGRFQALLDKRLSPVFGAPSSAAPSATDLITANLRDSRARHLMLIVRGDAGTCLLALPKIREALNDPVVMLASRFKEDLGEEHNYRQLSRIILHMQAGRQVVIKDHDAIYGALYDPLNQNYRERTSGDKVLRNCRVALGNTAKHCHVDENFKLIMLEEEYDLDHSDPPRLNRCEKQRLTYDDVLAEIGGSTGQQLLKELRIFCAELASVDGDTLRKRDAFLGFTEDTLPSLLVREILRGSECLDAAAVDSSALDVPAIRRRCRETLLDLMPADAVARAECSLFAKDPENEKELLPLIDLWYSRSEHAGLCECLSRRWPHLVQGDPILPPGNEQSRQLPLAVLTFTPHTCRLETILQAGGVGTEKFKILHIANFASEARLRAELENFWTAGEACTLLLLQCDAALHAQHLLLTREIMCEYERAYKDADILDRPNPPKAQVIILHVRRFQVGDADSADEAGRWEFSHLSEWKQLVVDRLDGTRKDIELLHQARSTSTAGGLLLGTWCEERVASATLQELIVAEMPWSIRRLAYPHREPHETLDYIDGTVAELRDREVVLLRLEQRLRTELMADEHSGAPNGRWLQRLAQDQGALVKTSSLTLLVEATVKEAVRRPLARLLHQLEGRSALASLRCTKAASPKERLWLDVYLPQNGASLGAAPGSWGSECMPLASHHMSLKWQFSVELMRQLAARRADFTKIGTTSERERSIKQGLCLQFVSDEDDTLRRLVSLMRGLSGDTVPGDAENVVLGSQLEAMWRENREAFRDDVLGTVAASLARETGVQTERVLSFVKHVLGPSYAADGWHPADVQILSWKVQPKLRHALQLFLLVDCTRAWRATAPHGDITADLAAQAAASCLKAKVEPIDAWLSRSQRCLKHADALREEGIILDDRSVLQQLRVCTDFATRIVFGYGGHFGLAALARLVKADAPLDGSEVDETAAQLQCDAGDPAIVAALVRFRTNFVVSQLVDACGDAAISHVCRGALSTFLRAEANAPGAGRAAHAALEALGLLQPYTTHRGNANSFGALTALIEESMLDAGGAAARLVCSTLQVHFGKDVALQLGAVKRGSKLPPGGSTRKHLRHAIDDVSSLASGRAGLDAPEPLPAERRPPPHEVLCGSFLQAVTTLDILLGGSRPRGAALYHLAFVKAFMSATLPIVGRDDACALRSYLAGVLQQALDGSSKLQEALQHYALRELRLGLSMDALIMECKEGALGARLPCLLGLAWSVEVTDAASRLGFDPYAYVPDYRGARDAVQAAFDGSTEHLAVGPHAALFATASAVYLPRSLKSIVDLHAASKAIALVASADDSLSLLARRIAANDFTHLDSREAMGALALTPASERTHVFAASLAVHLAGAFDATGADTCPIAAYIFAPAQCVGEFLLAAPSNELANALRAVTDATQFYRCGCGYAYAVGNCGQTVGTGTCPSCGKSIGNEPGQAAHNRLAAGNQLLAQLDGDEPGYVDEGSQNGTSALDTVRELPPLAYRALHLLVHLGLFTGALLGTQGLRQLLPKKIKDPAMHCWTAVLGDMRVLPQLLHRCTAEQACAWVHNVIEKLPAMQPATTAGGRLTAVPMRAQWEAAFASAFVATTTTATPHEWVTARAPSVGPRPLLFRQVDEQEAGAEGAFFPRLFAPVDAPSFDGLRASFVASGDAAAAYPFLALTLGRIELLELVQHLWPLRRWEAMLRERWGGVLSKEVAQRQQIGELLDDASAADDSCFDEFAASWNALVRAIQAGGVAEERYRQEGDCHPVEPKHLEPIGHETSVSMCCITRGSDESNLKNLLHLFLQMLGRAQNDFLAETVPIVQGAASLQALHLGGGMVNLGVRTPLSQLQRVHVLLDNTSDASSSLRVLKHSMLTFGCCGRAVHYDFDGVEGTAMTRLLTSTTLVDVDVEVTTFPFLGALRQESAVDPLSALPVALQEPLDNTRRLCDEPFLQETHHAAATLALLELVIYNATKSRPSPDERLRAYCETFELGRGPLERRALDCEAVGGAHLRHLRSLYETIEDLVADAMIPAVPHRFRLPLPNAVAVADTACLALGGKAGRSDAVAMKVGLLRLEPVLKKFICRQLMESTEVEPTYPLQSSAMDERHFPWLTGDEPTDEDLAEAFPMPAEFSLDRPGDTVLVSHAFELLEELRKRGGGPHAGKD
jgi:hypothetical protein